MRAKFTRSFKIQAVEKALSRKDGITVKEVADSLGVGHSTLGKWLIESRNQSFEDPQPNEISPMTKEKRPQDWSQQERLEMVIRCGSLSKEELSGYCREKGVYPHHVVHWKEGFVAGSAQPSDNKSTLKVKNLNHENKKLKKELRRKEKALAEAAALLILQKKVNGMWENDEDDIL